MAEPHWIEYAVGISTAIAALATAASAVVIAIQSKHTKDSAKASERAVEVANRTLMESQLARLEAGAPRWHVFASASIPIEDIWALETRQKLMYEVGPASIFRLPRDEDTELAGRYEVSITNDGPGSVDIRTNAKMQPPISLVIPPKETRTFKVHFAASVKDWVKISADPEHLVHTVEFVNRGPKDADVTESISVELRGTILLDSATARGDWTYAPFHEAPRYLSAQVLPSERTYWKSRSMDEKFNV